MDYTPKDIELLEIPVSENKSRTVRDFVEDMISDGKTEKEILHIAQSTRWQNKVEEIKEYIVRLKRRMEKRKAGKE